MAKVRGLLVVGLLGALLYCAAPAQAAVVEAPAQARSQVQVQTAAPAEALLPAPRQAAPGPVLDPTQTDKANAQKTRNKLIAGGIAVVLLAIVFFGRRKRKKGNG
ncbi:hypothetical protein QRX50_02935 [Amycolatopsis carbonis]|uniref:LPXTG cell wall anchor domain-containing protein n=1 Tax=Amycolatopsis carbonis TaxID=715471 RepID=A0A9Y2IJK6_9PSEU|nr:hypothetical protein [Amycolatopsis sp. 2-15]WIX79773.1 hypothetical protein QRX50_02935 [Amycolatopsis sp. 2-15]